LLIGRLPPGLRSPGHWGMVSLMDLSERGGIVTLISAVVILAGILGVVLPVLPGLLLAWFGVLLWAVLGDAGSGRWVVLGLATLVAVVGTGIKYLWPRKRLKTTGVPTLSMLAGGVLGIIGFFVVPVVGLPIGFVLGIWLAELGRVGSGRAWVSTREALTAVGLAMLVEFAAAVGVAVVWLFGVLAL
jgi:uncharacterized protein YqgC (DUF456 family)